MCSTFLNFHATYSPLDVLPRMLVQSLSSGTDVLLKQKDFAGNLGGVKAKDYSSFA